MYINKKILYEAIDSQPELVGSDYTDRVWELLSMLMIEQEANDHMRWGQYQPGESSTVITGKLYMNVGEDEVMGG